MFSRINYFGYIIEGSLDFLYFDQEDAAVVNKFEAQQFWPKMIRFLVPARSTAEADGEKARSERAAARASKAAAAASLGLPWPNPIGKRVGAPSRRDYYVDAVYKHIDENASLPTDVTLDVPGWWRRGMGIVRTVADLEKDHAQLLGAKEVKKDVEMP